MKIFNWNILTTTEQQNILSRAVQTENQELALKTKQIIEKVKLKGDQALFEFTQQFDNITLSQISVTNSELDQAILQVTPSARKAIEFAKQQIEKNHQLPKDQVIQTCEGVWCERQVRAIERVGLYIPGGGAPLVSTVLMLAVPALIAKCSLRILCTPPNAKGEVDPHILYAAHLCGIDQIYKVGGAQAIAAMAYGTNTIPKVDKIYGPGNSWVTAAKIIVAQDPKGANIDMPAGPSELMIIADDDANPEYIAADLLSQAEHGVDSQVILIALSPQCASRVKQAVDDQLNDLPRKNIIKQSLSHSSIIVVDSVTQAIAISNAYAPEHLIIQVKDYQQYIAEIKHAGAVFLGAWTPETVGDYVTGSNHVLPTYGYARTYSGLSVVDFIKFINFQTVTKTGLKIIGPFAERLAEIEGLRAHQQAVSLRLTEVMCNE